MTMVRTVLVTGASGFLGTSMVQALIKKGYEVLSPTKKELDLRDRHATLRFFSRHSFDSVIHCAARVGGIIGNLDAGEDFFLDNLEIDASVLDAAAKKKIDKVIYISSSCMYPRGIERPMTEDDLMGGRLEKTSELFSLSKIVGSQKTSYMGKKLNLNWKVLVLSNLFGPGDHFDDSRSHMLSNLISKAVKAKFGRYKSLEMWGDGTPIREFTFVHDVSHWLAGQLENAQHFPAIMNVGSGTQGTILDYYQAVIKAIELEIPIEARTDIPNGTPVKVMNSSKARDFEWHAQTPFEEGLRQTIDWYLASLKCKEG